MTKKLKHAVPTVKETVGINKDETPGNWRIRQTGTDNCATREGVFTHERQMWAEFSTKGEAEQHANDHRFKSDMITLEQVPV